MTSIPQEILHIIIGYATADQPRYFSSISLVSHIFHQIVLPYKFRSLTISFNIHQSIAVIYPKFCEALNAEDAHALSLAPLVRELHLLHWLDSKYLVELFEKIIIGVLSFRNLTKLSMVGCSTSPAIMERLGQLQSLRALSCREHEFYDGSMVSHGALNFSNLQSLHTLEYIDNYNRSRSQQHSGLASIPMTTLRILKSNNWELTKAFLTTDPPVQLEKLQLDHDFREDYLLLWNYLARVTSLTHLSLPNLWFQLPHPSLIFPLPELQYLHVNLVSAPLFADQSMKEMDISTRMSFFHPTPIMNLVRQHWQGIVFPHVRYLKMDRFYDKESILFELREILPNLKKVDRRTSQKTSSYVGF